MIISLGPTLEFISFVFTCRIIAWILWQDEGIREAIEAIIESFGPRPKPPTKKG